MSRAVTTAGSHCAVTIAKVKEAPAACSGPIGTDKPLPNNYSPGPRRQSALCGHSALLHCSGVAESLMISGRSLSASLSTEKDLSQVALAPWFNRVRRQSGFPTFIMAQPHYVRTSATSYRAVTIAPRWKHLRCQHGITGGTLARIWFADGERQTPLCASTRH